MDDLADGGSGINLVFGQFEGRVHSYDQGAIYSHTLDLQYGRRVDVLERYADQSLLGGAIHLWNVKLADLAFTGSTKTSHHVR